MHELSRGVDSHLLACVQKITNNDAIINALSYSLFRSLFKFLKRRMEAEMTYPQI
jgi:hypothetical protein